MVDKDSFALTFLFASEEYSEFVGFGYQDMLTILLKGPGLGNGKHLAVVPGTKQFINVNTVSVHKNKKYYIDNNPFDLNGKMSPGQKAKADPDLLAQCQYDGLTRPFSVGSRVQPRTKYHLQIAIADAGDGDNDSAVLLEAGSMQSHEQYWRVLRRRQIAEQRRADSLARVQAIADSIAAAEAYADSVNAAMQNTLIGEVDTPPDSGASTHDPGTAVRDEIPAPPQEEPVATEPVAADPAEIKQYFAFAGDGFLLDPADEDRIADWAAYLERHPDRKVGIYSPDEAQSRDLRYDLVRAEFLKNGVAPARIFRNGFSYLDAAGKAEAGPERIEIWIR